MRERKTGQQTTETGHPVSDRPHPYKSYLFYALTGSSILFLALSCIYIIWLTHNPPEIKAGLPKYFIVSTVLLMLSGFTVSQTNKAFLEDNNPRLLINLALTLVLGISFAGFEVLGWMRLTDSGFFKNGDAVLLFMFAICAVHMLHLVGGLLYLLFLNFKVYDNWNDPVRCLIYFTNRYELIRLDLITVYWHYINLSWLVLYLTFLFTL